MKKRYLLMFFLFVVFSSFLYTDDIIGKDLLIDLIGGKEIRISLENKEYQIDKKITVNKNNIFNIKILNKKESVNKDFLVVDVNLKFDYMDSLLEGKYTIYLKKDLFDIYSIQYIELNKGQLSIKPKKVDLNNIDFENPKCYGWVNLKKKGLNYNNDIGIAEVSVNINNNKVNLTDVHLYKIIYNKEGLYYESKYIKFLKQISFKDKEAEYSIDDIINLYIGDEMIIYETEDNAKNKIGKRVKAKMLSEYFKNIKEISYSTSNSILVSGEIDSGYFNIKGKFRINYRKRNGKVVADIITYISGNKRSTLNIEGIDCKITFKKISDENLVKMMIGDTIGSWNIKEEEPIKFKVLYKSKNENITRYKAKITLKTTKEIVEQTFTFKLTYDEINGPMLSQYRLLNKKKKRIGYNDFIDLSKKEILEGVDLKACEDVLYGKNIYFKTSKGMQNMYIEFGGINSLELINHAKVDDNYRVWLRAKIDSENTEEFNGILAMDIEDERSEQKYSLKRVKVVDEYGRDLN